MFINLNREERKDIIEATAQKMKIDPVIIEKDRWVVQTLNHLFQGSYAQQLTFKGGTSLSKAYQLIDRFSEDIDITINKHFLSPDFNLQLFEELSRKKRDYLLKDLHSKTIIFIRETIMPHLQRDMPFSPILKISKSDPLSIEIYYESVLSSQISYIQPRIYVEFGFRGSINPAEKRPVQTYIQDIFGNEIDPLMIMVTTLSPIKTFFEKATLLHAEYNRPIDKTTPLRLSRHYYDLYQMHQSEFLESLFSSYEILYEVIKHKNVFFASGWIDYVSILESGINMIPHRDRMRSLQKDYEETKIMIFNNPPHFNDIISVIAKIENMINKMIAKWRE